MIQLLLAGLGTVDDRSELLRSDFPQHAAQEKLGKSVADNPADPPLTVRHSMVTHLSSVSLCSVSAQRTVCARKLLHGRSSKAGHP